MSLTIKEIVDLVRRRIPYKIMVKSINTEEVLLRSEIKNLDETIAFIKAFETVTNSNFRVISNKIVAYSSVCKRKWICNHGVLSGLDHKCPATISILIKAINNQNLSQDAFLRCSPPLPALIKINQNHNHPTMTLLPSYKLLRVNNDVKVCFYEYFKRGYFGSKAKRLHEQYLQKANFFALDDESMNPTVPVIYTLGINWLKMKETSELDKAPNTRSFRLLSEPHIQKEKKIGQSSSQNFINVLDVVSKLKKEPDDEHTVTENIANKAAEEDIRPVLTIKQELIDEDDSYGTIKQELTDEDDNDGLPVISSCSSLAIPSFPPLLPQSVVEAANVKRTEISATQNIAAVIKFQSSPSQFVVYEPSSSTYKIVKCLSVNASNHSSNQYKSCLSSALVPMRISLQKL